MLEGWAESVRADLQSQGQVNMKGSGLEESTGQSWSRPPAWCLRFSAHGKIHLSLKTTSHPPAP